MKAHAAAVALLVVAECARGSSATLRPVCSRDDSPAVMLEMPAGARGQPHFRLRISRPLGMVAGQQVVVREPGDADANAEWCDAGGCRVVRPGGTTATFGKMRGDSSMTVRVQSARPDGKPFLWAGTARWKGATLVCG